MFLVSIESALRMGENDFYSMKISWKLFKLSKLKIWKFIYISVRFFVVCIDLCFICKPCKNCTYLVLNKYWYSEHFWLVKSFAGVILRRRLPVIQKWLAKHYFVLLKLFNFMVFVPENAPFQSGYLSYASVNHTLFWMGPTQKLKNTQNITKNGIMVLLNGRSWVRC